MTRIGIIGSGVVGSATGRGFQKLEHDVKFFDISKSKLKELAKLGYKTSNTLDETDSSTDICFVFVNTPTKNGEQDLSQVLSVLYDLTNVINDIDDYKLIVFRSTMLPGTIREVVVNHFEK